MNDSANMNTRNHGCQQLKGKDEFVTLEMVLGSQHSATLGQRTGSGKRQEERFG